MQRRASSRLGATIAWVGQMSMQRVQVPQCARRRRVHRQRQVDVDLAEEEPRAAVLVDQAGVLADPAEPGVARQRALEHRRRVDEHAMAERPHGLGDAVGQASAGVGASACGNRGRARSARRRRARHRRALPRPRRRRGGRSRGRPRSPAACPAPVRPGARACRRGAPSTPSSRTGPPPATRAGGPRPRRVRCR